MDFILLLKYIFLGLIQGLTEPLPISSSGHLVIFEEFFKITINDLNFEIIVNTGSLIAIVFIFRKDIISLLKNSFNYLVKKEKNYRNDFNYALAILIAVIPAGVIGLIFKNKIEADFKNLTIVGVSLIVTALALSLVNSEAIENKKKDISFKDALVIGFFQVFSLIPGISRSGSTMVGGLSRKITFEDTMRFSFLLYIPISIGAIILGLFDLQGSDPYVLGYLSAFIVSVFATYFAVKLLYSVVKKGNLKYFSLYCLIVGMSVLIVNYIIEVV